jgi:hypothetical protein
MGMNVISPMERYQALLAAPIPPVLFVGRVTNDLPLIPGFVMIASGSDVFCVAMPQDNHLVPQLAGGVQGKSATIVIRR